MIPEINKNYNCFDDGKIRKSRMYELQITGISKFEDMDDKEYISDWEKEVFGCPWLYNPSTDYFINGYIEELDSEITFVRCVDNGWFSFGLKSCRLDIDGKLTNSLN